MTLRLNNDNGNSASIDYIDGVSTDSTITIPEGNGTLVTSDFTGDVNIEGDVEITNGADTILLNPGGTSTFTQGMIVGDGDCTIGANGVIATNGSTIIGTTDLTAVTGTFSVRDSGAASTTPIRYVNAGSSNTFMVRGDGDCENTSGNYTSTSDLKLKSNIVNAKSQWNDIKAVQLRNYTLKSNGEHHLGVVAQELAKTSPQLVQDSALKDEDGNHYKAVKYSILFLKAVGALQEAITRIETLETEVQALKGGAS